MASGELPLVVLPLPGRGVGSGGGCGSPAAFSSLGGGERWWGEMDKTTELGFVSFPGRWLSKADVCSLTSCATEKYMWFQSCNFPSLQMTQGLDFVNEPLSPRSDVPLQGLFQKGVAQRRVFSA